MLHGAMDEVIDLTYPREAAQLLGDHDVHVFDDCGHFPHQENPPAFNEALRTALQSLQ
jgi:pimeloyl-ACP methyl ester carboxylesterase